MVEILDFYANWCIPCKRLGPILDQVEKETDIKITKIDVDAEEHERTVLDYAISSVPTLIILKNGKPVKKLIGVIDKQTIIKATE